MALQSLWGIARAPGPWQLLSFVQVVSPLVHSIADSFFGYVNVWMSVLNLAHSKNAWTSRRSTPACRKKHRGKPKS